MSKYEFSIASYIIPREIELLNFPIIFYFAQDFTLTSIRIEIVQWKTAKQLFALEGFIMKRSN